MEIPQYKDGELLSKWCERIAYALKLDDRMLEIIKLVSTTSYVKGNDDMLEALKTTNESNNTNKTN
jgi:hypothetical protein